MRTERLLTLLQALRRRHLPVSGRSLADELGISLRTFYRDIAALQALGAQIEGEAGVGYVLHPSYFLPPLMFSSTEIEALTLGMRWVSTFADKPLSRSADDALAKIEAVLPPDLRGGIGAMPLRVGPPPSEAAMEEDLSELRRAIRDERKLEMLYRDRDDRQSQRIIWPFALVISPMDASSLDGVNCAKSSGTSAQPESCKRVYWKTAFRADDQICTAIGKVPNWAPELLQLSSGPFNLEAPASFPLAFRPLDIPDADILDWR